MTTAPIDQAAGHHPLVALADSLPLAERIRLLVAQRQAMMDIIRQVMQEGVHYGYIYRVNPRTKQKVKLTERPTLHDPGALVLQLLWGLRGVPVFEREEEELEADPPRMLYVVRYELYHIRTGILAGCGYGAANSLEERWRYRWVPESQLPDPAQKDSLPKRIARTEDGEHYWQYRIPNQELAGLQNTIRKMAVIRARRDAVLTVTASKDLFTQDLDELEEWVRSEAEAAEAAEAESAADPKASGDGSVNRPSSGGRRRTQPAPPAQRPSSPAAPEPGTSTPPLAPEGPNDPSSERPVLPKEWQLLVNDATTRGWSQPQIAEAYRAVAGKTLTQRPTREEFKRLQQALSGPPPGGTGQPKAPGELPF